MTNGNKKGMGWGQPLERGSGGGSIWCASIGDIERIAPTRRPSRVHCREMHFTFCRKRLLCSIEANFPLNKKLVFLPTCFRGRRVHVCVCVSVILCSHVFSFFPKWGKRGTHVSKTGTELLSSNSPFVKLTKEPRVLFPVPFSLFPSCY